jgi:hypothetical protein
LVERSLFRQAVSEKSFLATIAWLRSHRPIYHCDSLRIDVHELNSEIDQRLAALLDQQSRRDLLVEAVGDQAATIEAHQLRQQRKQN